MREDPQTEATSDEQLMVSVMAGSEEAFDELVGRYASKITNFVHRQVSHFATAEELAQDTFLTVFRKSHTFKPGHKFSSWLYKIAVNVCRMHFRKARGVPLTLSIEETQEDGGMSLEKVLVDDAEGPLEALSRKDAEVKLREAIQSLPVKQRQVFAMSYYEEMSYEEIGCLLGCSPGTVASRKHAAVKRLAAKLKKLSPGLAWLGERRGAEGEAAQC